MSRKLFVNWLFALMAICFIGVFYSCSDDDDERTSDETVAGDSISVSVSSMTFAPEGGSQTVFVSANGPWTANDVYWLTASPSSGTGDCEVVVTAADNSYEGSRERTGVLTFSLDSGAGSVSVVITQERYVPDDGVLKILAIGNSFSEDSVEQYLWELFDAAGIEAVLGNMYIGGCSLETHYNNATANASSYSYRKIVNGEKNTTSSVTMLAGIQDEDWDYITLQQVSGLSGLYETYDPYLPYLVRYVRENCPNSYVEVAFHQTWAYASNSTHSDFPKYGSNQMTMYNAIMDASRQAVEDNGIKIIIPSGTAIQNGRNSWIGDNFNRDGYHLNYDYGRYTASCTWFETFSGIDVTTTTYQPSGVSDSQKEVCVHAAHFAVQNPYEADPMTDWKVAP